MHTRLVRVVVFVLLLPMLIFTTILEERGRLNTSKWPINSDWYPGGGIFYEVSDA